MKLSTGMIIASALAVTFGVSTQAAEKAQVAPAAMENGFALSETLEFPPFDAALGRVTFAQKGCVVCHQINGVGGEDGPDLTYGAYDTPIDAMDVAADLWAKAGVMIAMQEDELGAQIELSSEELASIIAFLASAQEQASFSMDDVPEAMQERMAED